MQIDNLSKMIFIHIPRTGGGAFSYSTPGTINEQHLKPYYVGGAFIYNTEENLSTRIGRHGTWKQNKKALDIIRADVSQYKLITFIRNPIDRIFSAFRYLTLYKKTQAPWKNINDMLDEVERAPFGKVHWTPQTYWLLENNEPIDYFKIYRFEDVVNDISLIQKDFPLYNPHSKDIIQRQGNYKWQSYHTDHGKHTVDRIKKIYKEEHRYLSQWYKELK